LNKIRIELKQDEKQVEPFFARGFQEQRVFIVPSKNLVWVRFGATLDKSAWNDEAFVSDMLARCRNKR
jgi:hypothetical protein